MNRSSFSFPHEGLDDRPRVRSGMQMKHGARRGLLPSVEALESRLVLSALAGTPPVTMISATATDSHSITISYRVNQAVGVNQPLQFGVYRSTDAQFDSSDTLVSTWTASTQGQGQVSATLDAAGQPAAALGTHQLTIPMPGGLPPDPQKPYVLVVADPTLPGALSDPAQTAAFRTYVIGIVTHGGLQNTHWKFGPAWQAKTAAILKSQSYDAVIAYHWMSDSNHPGRAARQGPRLASEILAVASQFPAGAPIDLHFIGHSEGAVVNTQAIVSLESTMTPELKAGYIKDTLLDPHAANNGVAGQQYSLTGGPLGWFAKAEIDSFQSKAKDPAVFIPSVVNDAEVFYQHTLASHSHGVNSGIYNLWGEVPVKGPADYYNLTAAGATHAGETGVSTWYANFVAPTLGGQAPLIQTLQFDAQIDHVVATTTPSVRATARQRDLGPQPIVQDHQVEFSGTAAAGSTVRLYVGPASKPSNITPAGRTTTDAAGRWTLMTHTLPSGHYRAVVMSFSRALRSRRALAIIPTVPIGGFVVAKS